MAASVASACHSIKSEEHGSVPIGAGLLDLLLKAAAHPSVETSAIALEVLKDEVSSATGLVHQVLPILQGRAITPHQFINGQVPSIADSSFESFSQFRDSTLTDTLLACWGANPETYMSSCVAAVQEFCRSSSSEVSFHLEAALYCLGALEDSAELSSYFAQCIEALAGKPVSLTSNPLTLSQACRFVKKVGGG